MSTKFHHKGRGAISNADGRYEAYSHAAIDDGWGILDEQPPALKTEHIMRLIRQSSEGKENDAHFGSHMRRGTGLCAEMIEQRFRLACKRLDWNRERLRLDTGQFRVPARAGNQLALF